MKQTKKPKKPQKPSPKFAGKSCELCGKRYELNPRTEKYPRFITHHIRYDNPEVTAVVCLACHNWLSGNGKVYSHPLKPRDMTPEQRASGPATFAAWVVELYYRKLYAVALESIAILQDPSGEKTH